jgi:hypothetical protein
MIRHLKVDEPSYSLSVRINPRLPIEGAHSIYAIKSLEKPPCVLRYVEQGTAPGSRIEKDELGQHGCVIFGKYEHKANLGTLLDLLSDSIGANLGIQKSADAGDEQNDQ